MKNFIREAQRLQAELAERQKKIAEARVEASSGGGVVRAVVSGTGDLVELVISPEVLGSGEAEMVADLVVAAVQEAQRKARELAQAAMAEFTRLLPPGMGS